jgi:hypothetical protein
MYELTYIDAFRRLKTARYSCLASAVAAATICNRMSPRIWVIK